MTRTATAYVFEQAGQPLTRREFPIPDPAPGEAIVRVTCCTLCGSDLHTVRGDRETPVPTVLGHEIVGVVDALPDEPPTCVDGTPLQLGQRVVWSVAASCGACFFCTHELPQKCESLFKYGHERLTPGRELSGGLAEACLLVPGTAIVPVPDELPNVVAAPAGCATATVTAAFREAGNCSDEVVLIHGAGMLGLTACAMARSNGARVVILADLHADRLASAETFGATHTCSGDELDRVVRETTGGRGIDLHLELAGSGDAAAQGLDLLRIGGRSVWVGAVRPTAKIAVDPESVVRRMLRLIGVHNYRPEDLEAGLRFLVEQHPSIPFADLVRPTYALGESATALLAAETAVATRVAVMPHL